MAPQPGVLLPDVEPLNMRLGALHVAERSGEQCHRTVYMYRVYHVTVGWKRDCVWFVVFIIF